MFNWGIIGPGKIAHQFAEGLKVVADAKLAGVAARNLENAEQFAHHYQIDFATDNCESLINNPTIDAIYIATPHNSHHEIAIQCLQGGKAVLCEKPLAVNSRQVEEMIAAAKASNTFLMEALWSRFIPHIHKMVELSQSDNFGDIDFIDTNFAFMADPHPAHRCNNPDLAGGSLLDIGIYPLFLCYLLLGKPKNIIADALMNEQGVDHTLQMLLQFESARASIFSSFKFNAGANAHIYSTKGNSIHILDKFNAPSNLVTRSSSGEKETISFDFSGNGYNYQVEEVHRCLADDRLESKLWSWQDSLNLMNIMDNVRDKIGLKYPFEN